MVSRQKEHQNEQLVLKFLYDATHTPPNSKKNNTQFFHLDFNGRPFTFERALHFKICGFLPCVTILLMQKLTKFSFLNCLEIRTQVSQELPVWFFPSKSQSKFVQLYTQIRLKHQVFWSAHQDPDSPKIQKMLKKCLLLVDRPEL